LAPAVVLLYDMLQKCCHLLLALVLTPAVGVYSELFTLRGTDGSERHITQPAHYAPRPSPSAIGCLVVGICIVLKQHRRRRRRTVRVHDKSFSVVSCRNQLATVASVQDITSASVDTSRGTEMMNEEVKVATVQDTSSPSLGPAEVVELRSALLDASSLQSSYLIGSATPPTSSPTAAARTSYFSIHSARTSLTSEAGGKMKELDKLERSSIGELYSALELLWHEEISELEPYGGVSMHSELASTCSSERDDVD